jgi:hypothetical protein
MFALAAGLSPAAAAAASSWLLVGKTISKRALLCACGCRLTGVMGLSCFGCFGCTDFWATGGLRFAGAGVRSAFAWLSTARDVGVSGVGYRNGIAVWSRTILEKGASVAESDVCFVISEELGDAFGPVLNLLQAVSQMPAQSEVETYNSGIFPRSNRC